MHIYLPKCSVNRKKGEIMQPKIIKANAPYEYLTPERCSVAENYSRKDVSIARATVKSGVATAPHHLIDVQEIYIITNGQGRVTVGDLEPTDVSVGDVVVIPPMTSQRIANTGTADLVFYCVCTPRFTQECYVSEQE
jgi:mannose-6-phosphate isomerase-like protein (cupin superfamily)